MCVVVSKLASMTMVDILLVKSSVSHFHS